MAVEWNLKDALATQGIQNAPQLERSLQEVLGVRISRVALDKLLKKEPLTLKIQTAQLFCDLLQASLESFLTIKPEPVMRDPGGIIQPYGKQPQAKDALIVDPRDFF